MSSILRRISDSTNWRKKNAFYGWVSILTVVFYALAVNADGSHKAWFQAVDADYSADRSIRVDKKTMTINLSNCTRDKIVFFGDSGSTLLAVGGLQTGHCQVRYVTEMEQSGWQWDKARNCLVPTELAYVVMPIQGAFGLQTLPLQGYCVSSRQPE